LLAYIDASADKRNKRYYFYVDENGEVLPIVADTIIEFDDRY